MRQVISKADVEKKLKTIFKDAQFEVQVEGKGIKLAIDGVGETPGELFSKIGGLIDSIMKVSGTKDVDVIVSMQGSAFGIEIDIY
ncbi:MAG: hypothetical protein ABWK01_00400 [Infirmifilum sp.]